MSFLKKFKNKRFRNNSFKSNNFRSSSFGSSGFNSKNKGFKNNPFKNKRFKIYAGIAVIILLILGVLAYVDSKTLNYKLMKTLSKHILFLKMKKYL